jgi:hypothetical protein
MVALDLIASKRRRLVSWQCSESELDDDGDDGEARFRVVPAHVL